MRLSSFFGRSADLGPVVQSVVHVDARDLAFTDAPDGIRLASVESHGDDVRRQRPGRRTGQPPLHGAPDGRAVRAPGKRPGPYHLRVALRDVGADRIGPASQFIHLPDLGKGQLTLSTLFMQGRGAGGTTDGAMKVVDPATVAVRRFRRRSALTSYVCYGYNVARDSFGKSRVESQTWLLRDGVEVFRSGPQPAQASTAPNELPVGGTLQLSRPTAISWSSRSPTAKQGPRGAQRGPSISRLADDPPASFAARRRRRCFPCATPGPLELRRRFERREIQEQLDARRLVIDVSGPPARTGQRRRGLAHAFVVGARNLGRHVTHLLAGGNHRDRIREVAVLRLRLQRSGERRRQAAHVFDEGDSGDYRDAPENRFAHAPHCSRDVRQGPAMGLNSTAAPTGGRSG
jgi:hypothetical protein